MFLALKIIATGFAIALVLAFGLLVYGLYKLSEVQDGDE